MPQIYQIYHFFEFFYTIKFSFNFSKSKNPQKFKTIAQNTQCIASLYQKSTTFLGIPMQ